VGRGTNLLEQAAFLDDVCDRLHFAALCLVDVLQREQLLGLFVLDDPDLHTNKETTIDKG
jgi:hypothetical protein